MEYPVVHQGETVGNCIITEQGLYWYVDCTCRVLSDRIERLYCGTKRLGVLEREGENLTCRRRLSKASTPELPPKSGILTLTPEEPRTVWQGTLLGQELTGFQEGDHLLFPYDETKPCPCEPLICFFEVKDGFWRIPCAPFQGAAERSEAGGCIETAILT